MAILPIIETPDLRLKAKSTPVESIDESLQQLIDDMLDTMYHAPGIGLAAIQVGVPKRVLVIDLQEQSEGEEEIVRNPLIFINPIVSEPSGDMSVYNEGCLSVPEQYAEVTRPESVRVTWQDREGRLHDERIDGLLATCLQHEMDHLEGILFIDHLSRLKREMALKKLSKMRKLAA